MAKKEVSKHRSEKFLIGECRASYAYVFTPRVDEDGKPTSYGVTLMIPKDGNAFQQKSIKAIQDRVDAAFAHLVKEGAITAKQAATMKEDPKTCAWKDGDGDWNSPELSSHKPEYVGHWILVVSNKLKNTDGTLIQPTVYYGAREGGGRIENANDFVSGDYCFAEVVIATYTDMSVGVTAFFNSLKKSRQGEPFSSSAPRESAYDEILDEFPDEDEAPATGVTEKEDEEKAF